MSSEYMYDRRIHAIVKQRYPVEGWRKIGAEEGLTKNQVEALARKLKISRRGVRKAQAEALNKIIVERYPTEGPEKLAEELSLTVASVILRANRNGAHIPSEARYKKMSETMTERFDTLDLSIWDPLTSNGVYYLGLLWADGTIHNESPEEAQNRDSHYNVVLGLSGEEDHVVIYQLTDLLHLPHDRVREVKKYQEQHKLRRELKLSGKRIVQLMTETYNLQPRKSFIDPVFPNIPDVFLGEFARGVFDGDGSPRHQGHFSYRFYGSFRFMDEFCDRVAKLAGLVQYSLRVQEESIKVFTVGHPVEVDKLTDFLYPQWPQRTDFPHLPRKAKPFFDLKQSVKERGRAPHPLRPGYETFRKGTREVLIYGEED